MKKSKKPMFTKTVVAAALFAGASLVQADDATITGKVTLKGTATPEKSIDMAADAACKSLHETSVTTRHWVANSDGTLQNVLVYIKAGPSVDGKSFTPAKAKIVLDQKGCLYLPYVFGVQVGQEFEIFNSDNTLHNVHALPANNDEFNKGQPVQGMKFNHKFTKAEFDPPVKFKCDVHPWMFAYCAVFPHPFFDVTREAGTFKISGLAPGKYTLVIWHHKGGSQTQEVEVKAGETKTVDITIEAK